jgi:lysozyme family protein
MTEELLFQKALALVLENEGGFLSAGKAEQIGDPGGETFCGITVETLARLRRTWPTHFGHIVRPRDMRPSEGMLAYRLAYWPYARKFRQSPPVAVAFMDAVVQHGPSKATKLLQRAVGAEEDGEWGPLSVRAFAEYGIENGDMGIAYAMIAVRTKFLRTWVKLDPRRKAMAAGLESRMQRVTSFAEAVRVRA